MWKISLLCNTLLMSVFGFASFVSQLRLLNAVHYEEFEGKPLPILSNFMLNAEWLTVAIPVLWIIAGLTLLVRNWKREKPPRDLIQLHTSITLLVGITMLLLFAVAGILPFVPITVGLSGQ